jgi:ATP-dependent helicase Lhr and Lhr-like helicase
MSDQEAELLHDRRIAATLRLTWDAFFSRFGTLTPVQREVIPKVLSGQDLLVCSPTASGKTEAVCAPLLERLGPQQMTWTVLYVCPTRALVNDLYHRLEGPVGTLGHRLIRRTGEHKTTLSGLTNVLLTTPESFDSLLCRAKLKPQGHVLAFVCAVVVDEIHLLRASARGAQLRWLLQRLRRLRKYALQQGWVPTAETQTVALSATVADPQEVCQAYLPGGQVVALAGQRAIEEDVLGGPGPTERVLPRRLAFEKGPRKVLVFCNKRKRVDELAAELRSPLEELGYAVEAHHGSLSQRVREDAEEEMRLADRIVLFSTSTLEIGVDIGDIDLVVLDAPPPDVPSLLQRIGRGNRRSDQTVVMACSENRLDVLLNRAMLQCARNGDLGPVRVGKEYAVARQQVASFILQADRPWREQSQLAQLMVECEPTLDANLVIDHLVGTGELTRDVSRVRLGPPWLERADTGSIHSNIEAPPGSDVVDGKSGQVLAHNVSSHVGTTIGVGGKTRRVTERTENRIEVDPTSAAAAGGGQWRYSTQRRFVNAGQPYALRNALGIPELEWPVVVAHGASYAFHLGGGQLATVLQLIAPPGSDVLASPWFVRVSTSDVRKPSWLAEPDEFSALSRLEGSLDELENRLGRPRANQCLPKIVRLAELRTWLRLSDALGECRNAKWVSAPPPVAMTLRDLI